MPPLQRRQVPRVCEAGQKHVWGTPLLENPHRLQGLPVLRLGDQGRSPLHLPWLRGPRVLTTRPRLLNALLPAAGLGLLVGALARNSGEVGWIFALLVCSAVVTAIAQQTLP